MALNAKKIKGNSKKFVEQPNLPIDNYPARVVQVIDLGLQPGGEWAGEKKAPAHMIRVTYELVDAFMIDKDGNEIEDKPRWISEDLKMFSPDADLAKCNKRYKAIDPECVHDYNWGELLGASCTVLNVHKKSKGKTYDNVALVSPYVVSKRNPELPELVNEPKMFDLDEPDLDLFQSLPQWIQDKIKGNLEFKGSPLEALLSGDAPKTAKDEVKQAEADLAPEADEDDGDEPW